MIIKEKGERMRKKAIVAKTKRETGKSPERVEKVLNERKKGGGRNRENIGDRMTEKER